jgi:hypothetical protein
VGLSLPGRDPLRIGKLLAPRLEAIDPGFGIEVVTLIALEVEPISGRQARLEAIAAAKAIGTSEGKIEAALRANRESIDSLVISGDDFATAVIEWANKGAWRAHQRLPSSCPSTPLRRQARALS